MSTPPTSSNAPFAVDVQAGIDVWWCACGRSARQPFCDGSHRGSGVEPVRYTPSHDGKVWFCGCKRSARAPLCDGTHNRP